MKFVIATMLENTTIVQEKVAAPSPLKRGSKSKLYWTDSSESKKKLLRLEHRRKIYKNSIRRRY